jgi:hypothetical protein
MLERCCLQMDAAELQMLNDKGVFGSPGHLRIAFCVEPSWLRLG